MERGMDDVCCKARQLIQDGSAMPGEVKAKGSTSELDREWDMAFATILMQGR